jgi:hypothetical protein
MNGETKTGLSTISLGRLQCVRQVSTGPTERRRRTLYSSASTMGWTKVFNSRQWEIFLSYNPKLPSKLGLNPTYNSVWTRRRFFPFGKGVGGGEGATKHDDVHSPSSSGFSSITTVRLDCKFLRYRGKFTMCERWGLSSSAGENSDVAFQKNSFRTFRPSKMRTRVASKRRHPITHWRCFTSQKKGILTVHRV